MFDIGWSELFIIAVATLIVVGPKDLPVFLRTIGRYIGVLNRQASEFRAHFDEAIRDSELEQLQSDVRSLKSDVESSIKGTTSILTDELEATQKSLDDAIKGESDSATKSVESDQAPALEASGPSSTVATAVADTKQSSNSVTSRAESDGGNSNNKVPPGLQVAQDDEVPSGPPKSSGLPEMLTDEELSALDAENAESNEHDVGDDASNAPAKETQSETTVSKAGA